MNTNTSSSVVGTRIIPIEAFVSHCHIHLDEVAATWLVATLGYKFFPGAEKAPIRFVAGNPRGGDADYDSDKVLPLGCGGGRFDEHTPNGRKPDECSATLVAKYLGVEGRPGIKEILVEVLRCDQDVGTHGLQMAELIKAAHRCLPGGDRSVVKWAMMGLGWACRQIKMSYSPQNGTEPGAVSMFEKWLLRDKPDDKVKSFIRRLCEESEQRQDVTGVDFIIRAMHRGGKTIDEIGEWTLSAFRWIQTDQEQFHKAVSEIKTGKPDKQTRVAVGDASEAHFFRTNTPDGGGRFVQVLVVRTGDMSDKFLARRAHRAAMWLKPAVLIMRHPDGHTQVFCHQKAGLHPDVSADIAAQLRYYEGGREAGLTWDALQKSGDTECSPVWYYFKKAQAVMNGSESHPGVKPTELGLQTVIDVVRRALWYPALQGWQREMGVEFLPKDDKPQPLATAGEIAETHDRENGNGDKETKGA